MIPYERKEKILDILSQEELIRIEEFQNYIPGVSTSTLRRDLKELEKNNKVHLLAGGGVKLITSTTEIPISDKANLQTKEKQYIAKLAAKQINDGDTLYLDSGSTCFALLKEILNKKVHIITTNTDALSLVGDFSCEITLLGGTFNPIISSISGPLTEENIKQYIFDKAFLGANGVDVKYGVTTPDYVEASKKRVIINQARNSFLLCDSTKFHKAATVRAFDLAEVTLISDQTDKKLAKEMKIISK
ncbi:DeoR/GlpR family DNA-binding transcription regulator [Enterococcus alishanensis]|uniref:DeoR/GlpR family DNA-binding transcription regulator n=1 Tax=Enterococcus alishanensis TaxID=1303817 RepID=A0ABS6THA8_9ENTE|nr:DeoR/GlpR family DNA-binding transcription regulator [Enterococcus alishanensis]MBV7392262.1 DeoR/GlpR family DNA-binding transcription regulator [Enterococcus alishanensis]